MYVYLGQVKLLYGEYVRCLNEQGRVREFPVKLTNLHIPTECSANMNCVMSIDDLLALKEIVSSILSNSDV
jgi:hypothetical protein